MQDSYLKGRRALLHNADGTCIGRVEKVHPQLLQTHDSVAKLLKQHAAREMDGFLVYDSHGQPLYRAQRAYPCLECSIWDASKGCDGAQIGSVSRESLFATDLPDHLAVEVCWSSWSCIYGGYDSRTDEHLKTLLRCYFWGASKETEASCRTDLRQFTLALSTALTAQESSSRWLCHRMHACSSWSVRRACRCPTWRCWWCWPPSWRRPSLRPTWRCRFFSMMYPTWSR